MVVFSSPQEDLMDNGPQPGSLNYLSPLLFPKVGGKRGFIAQVLDHKDCVLYPMPLRNAVGEVRGGSAQDPLA